MRFCAYEANESGAGSLVQGEGGCQLLIARLVYTICLVRLKSTNISWGRVSIVFCFACIGVHVVCHVLEYSWLSKYEHAGFQDAHGHHIILFIC